MTVPAPSNRVSYVGNGATATFSFSFKISDASYLKVSTQAADGTVTELASGQYSATGIGSANGGTVTLSGGALASGATVTIRRVVPYTQPTSIPNQDGFLPQVVETAFDRLTWQTQQLAEQVGRAIVVPPTEGSGPILPAASSLTGGNKLLGPDPITGQIKVIDVSGQFKGDPGGSAAAIGLFSAAPSLLIPSGYDLVQTSGAVGVGEGAGLYRYDAAVDAAYVTANPKRAFRNSTSGRGYRLVDDRAVSVAQYGAVGDGVTDDTAAIQAAMNHFGVPTSGSSITNPKFGVVKFAPGRIYRVTGHILVPYNVSIDFNGAKVVPTGSIANFALGFLFLLNSSAAGAQIVPYSNAVLPPIMNGNIIDDNGIGARAFYSKSKHRIRRMFGYGLNQFFKKSGATDAEYTDFVELSELNFGKAQGTDYQIDIGYHGDALRIDRCHIYQETSADNANLVSVSRCMGGQVTRSINGNHKFTACMGMTMAAPHLEFGQIQADSSSLSLHDIYQWRNKVATDLGGLIYLSSSASDKTSQLTKISNWNVIHYEGRTGASETYSTDLADLVLDRYANVALENCQRRFNTNVFPSIGGGSAIKVSMEGGGGTPWSVWEDQAAVLTKGAHIRGGVVRPTIADIPVGSSAFAFGVPNGNGIWREATGAAPHYAWNALFGPVSRRLGAASGDFTAGAVTNGTSSAPMIQPNRTLGSTSDGLAYATLEIFRGAASGAYDKKVLAPIGSDPMMFDLGFHLGTGEYWQTRASGAADAVNTGYTNVRIKGANVEVDGPGAPTYGTWLKGDRIANANPTVGQPLFWICTATGTPGTWVAGPNL